LAVNGNGSDARAETPSQGATPPIPQLVLELRDLIVEYFKQETVVPLRQLGRYVTYGLLGALLLGIGAVLLGIGGLRALQIETGSTFTGNLSWVPYLIMVVVLLGVGFGTWQARGAVKRRREAR
jgi:hypothetical protein